MGNRTKVLYRNFSGGSRPENNLLIKKLPPPTPDRCERRFVPPRTKACTSNIDASPVCLGKTGVCQLGCVEFIYTSVSPTDTLSFVTTPHAAPQGSQPEQSATEQRNCRADIKPPEQPQPQQKMEWSVVRHFPRLTMNGWLFAPQLFSRQPDTRP